MIPNDGMWRVAYGNGQVSNTFRTRKEAERHLGEGDNATYGYIQRYVGDGEWFRAR